MGKISLNGQEVEFNQGETIWQVATRLGIEVPHLCYSPKPDYRADGNCRACMVEIKGERVLAASCIRPATAGMEVNTASERAKSAQKGVLELLLADQPPKEQAHNEDSPFWQWILKTHTAPTSRYPASDSSPLPHLAQDNSHPAMRVALDACIQCNLCVRACREVQVNDVLGMGGRGIASQIIFDNFDEMGNSTCVACGECVQACPTGALMPASMNDNQGKYLGQAQKVVNSLCPFCGVGCQTEVHVKDDKIVKVDGRMGPANRNRLCVKGRFGMDYARHDGRLTKPLIRLKSAPKKWDDFVDGKNPLSHFREATWQEAMDLIGKNFRDIKEKHGHKAFAGFGSAKGSNEEAYLFQKLIRTGFQTNNVDHCTRLCHASSVAALLEGIGSGAVSAPFTDALHADFIIVIGARPTENHPVAATFFKQAAKLGKKLVVMDPRGSGLVRHAWHHLKFKSGTDVALLSAMINVIITEGLTNPAYIEQYVENYQAIVAKTKDFTPEEMAPICGIDADIIRQVARQYATSKNSIIFWGMGISQSVHGTDNARALITLAAITGQVGRQGTGLHPLRGQNNVQGASDSGLIPMMFSNYQPVENDQNRLNFEKLWGVELDKKRGLTVVEIIHAILDDEIKAMLIMGENPAMSDPDAHHARMALAKLDFLVVQEIFLTETAFHADVILPASAFPEKWGSFTNTNRQVQLARPALKLPGQAKQDWEILQLIANEMRLNWQYKDVGEIFEEMRSTMSSIKGISWQRLLNEDAITYPCADEKDMGKAVIFGDGFPTNNKRAKLVPIDLLPPNEVPDAEYPILLTTGRLLEHWHTGAMTRRASVLDAIEPEAIVHVHPSKMHDLGIKQGDFITVATRRGSVSVKVRLDRDVAENMIFIPFCFAEGPANMLTNPALDPFGKIPEFKLCAARIEVNHA